MATSPKIAAARIVVIMPNWLGDGVMATPFLRALRMRYPEGHIAAVTRPLVAPVLAGLPFINDLFVTKKGEESAALQWLKQNKFDLGVLLPNSFRSAWLLRRGGVKRRLGYAREWRSLLLTDQRAAKKWTRENRLRVAKIEFAQWLVRYFIGRGKVISDAELNEMTGKTGGKLSFWRRGYQPVPTIEYYLKLAEYLGAPAESDTRMELGVTAAEREEAARVLAALGVADEPLVTIVPGANFGSSKCWPPERFAQLADRLIDKQGEYRATVLLASSPAELPIVEAILGASMLCPGGGGVGRLHALAKLNDGKGVSLGALKEIVRRSKMMICNDTGPRHFAAAFGIPCVTLFGPTDPVWAETWHPRERIVRIDVPCGPCQLKKCPIDHRCMQGIEVEMVLSAAGELWGGSPTEGE